VCYFKVNNKEQINKPKITNKLKIKAKHLHCISKFLCSYNTLYRHKLQHIDLQGGERGTLER